MQRYEKYKDSVIEWIGEIPEHWECKMIKRLSPVRRGASPRPIDNPIYFDNNGEYSWVRIADVSASERYLENTEQILSELGASLSVKRNPGDFFLSIAGSVGKPIISKIKCCIHDGFVYFPDLKINPEYLYYLFITGLPYKGLGKWGTQLNLNTDTVGEIYIPVPSETEVESLVFFLDRKTAEIDQIIANKQKLIALYEEEKQAIINMAVTKGLDPNVKMKDSGVEWLGEIPEGWEVKKLKYLVSKIGSGVTPTGGSNVYQTSGIPLLRSQNVYFDGLRLEDVAYISEEIDESMSNSRINERDILLNITGGSIGRCYYIPDGFGPGNVNQHVCIIRPILQKIDYIFLYFLLRSNIGQLQIDFQQTGANREGLNFEQLKNFIIPLMDISEQQSIVAHIERECSRLDAIISKFNKQIDLLQEYRTTLISEVVTGKIKVNE